MKKKIYLFVLFILALNTSCDDGFLDRVPYDGLSSSLIFNSDASALMAMNGAYSTLANLTFEAEFYNYVTNLGPDGFDYSRPVWGMSHSQSLATARDAQIVANYRRFYRPIIYANDIIAGMQDNGKVSEALRERMTGEAKFIRAICYFYLKNMFGKLVLLDKPTPVTETYLPRSTENEITDLIVKDLRDAAERLPVAYSSASDIGRVTKGAAIAMLGKVFLFEKKWQEAAAEFGKLLQAPFSYQLVTDYGDNFKTTTKNNVESVFELQYVQQDGMGSSFDRWYGNRSVQVTGGDRASMPAHLLHVFTKKDGSSVDFSTMPVRSAFPSEVAHGAAVTTWYEKSYADVDLRLHKSVIMPGATFIGAGNITYKLYFPYAPYASAVPPAINSTNNSDAKVLIRKFLTIGDEHTLFREDSQMNYPLIRFADVLLMYAEASNEAEGPGTSVYSAVDQVRARAGVVGLPAGLSKEEMRTAIWLERYKELLFEGHLYFDVKRWRTAHTNDPVFGLNHDVMDYRFVKVFYKKKFAERDYLWPVPQAEIDLNPQIEQNPGWQ
ncbi:RagB/SusD family nutrient uptake outer membrane protein [Ravibacter arvi]|uniref:RagB/SusD family nutrient uptake outer membrane protein n=1 Tax=Ravibacter arvi TaxID=2051041 RepID=A0ABP8M6C7_9BACT